MNQTVIVHIPYQLVDNPNSAPQIRPRRMIEAFQRIGCETIVVSGTVAQRRHRGRRIMKDVDNGDLHADFVYSESAGWPNAFSDGPRSFHPYVDERFLSFLHRHGVPVTLFYRDAYHRSAGFLDVPPARRLKRHFLKFLCESDLRRYNEYVSLLYLPSVRMQTQIPQYRGEVLALPPGAEQTTSVAPHGRRPGAPLRLLYVGGLGDLYRLHKVFEAVASTPGVQLTVCTRESDWISMRGEYANYLGPSIRIVHESGQALGRLYDDADAVVIAFEPNPYREFAAPVKLYEYISRGKAIIASEGTLAGEYVASNGLGWTIPYAVGSLTELLRQLASSNGPPMLEQKRSASANHAPRVSWQSRAMQVVDDVAAIKPREPA